MDFEDLKNEREDAKNEGGLKEREGGLKETEEKKVENLSLDYIEYHGKNETAHPGGRRLPYR